MRVSRIMGIVAIIGGIGTITSGCGGKSSSEASASASSGASTADAAAARKALEAPLQAITSYRWFVDPASDSGISTGLAGVASGEIARAAGAKPTGGGALTKGVGEALDALATACGTDVTKVTPKTDKEKIVALRLSCASGIKAFEASLGKLSPDLPKVPAGSREDSEKTPIGKLLAGGPAVKAYRDELAKAELPSTDAFAKLKTAAVDEMKGVATEFGKGATEDTLVGWLANVAPVAFDVETLRTSAAIYFCKALKGYEEAPPSDNSAVQDLCSKVQFPNPVPNAMKSCDVTRAKVCH